MGVLTGVVSSVTTAVSPGIASRAVDEVRAAGRELIEAATTLSESRVFRVAALGFAAYKTYHLFFTPLNHVQRNHEVGYITGERQGPVERATEVSKRRHVGDLPPVYPNGWYRLAESHTIANGEARHIHVLGLDLAVFRTESGKIACIDAYCPHLGANFAVGGEVCGETIKCPFHGWEFNSEGACVNIPYTSGKIPSNARVDKYTVMETNDQVLFWFDAEGRPPQWFPPNLEELNNGKWTFRGLTQHYINSHIQEVPENAADVAHLNYLHGPILLNGVDLRKTHNGISLRLMRHEWEAAWAAEPAPNQHLSVLNLKHKIFLLGYHLPVLDLDIVATQVGPGLVYLTFDSLFGSGVFIQTLTPEEPLYQSLTHCIYAEWRVPTIMAKLYAFGEASQVDRDVMIWNNKQYRGNPVLVKEDELIAKHRRWYKQFYSENSPSYQDAQRDNLDW